jgi:hypothetical protein
MDRGKTTHFVSSEQNVAARKQAEMALRDSEQLFSVVVQRGCDEDLDWKRPLTVSR